MCVYSIIACNYGHIVRLILVQVPVYSLMASSPHQMVAKIEMTAEDVAEEVRRYSILVGFLLIVVFVVPCVGFALLSKYCQKQRRKRRVSL